MQVQEFPNVRAIYQVVEIVSSPNKESVNEPQRARKNYVIKSTYDVGLNRLKFKCPEVKMH